MSLFILFHSLNPIVNQRRLTPIADGSRSDPHPTLSKWEATATLLISRAYGD